MKVTIFTKILVPQTGLSCRGSSGELEAGRRCTGRRTILHARIVCVFTVFERSRFTTLQRNGGYSHVCMCFISPRIVWGPLGCHLPSSLVPKSRFRGSGKITFFKKSVEVKKDAELPPEYFPCIGSAWILTWSWFINFSKSQIFANFEPFFTGFWGLFEPFWAF